MPQYRKLSTRTPESFDFNDLPDDFTRLTWVQLPLVSCSDGRGIDIPGWLIGRLYPLRQDVTPAMIDAAMSAFEAHGMVVRYAVDGRRYYQIVNWTKYQGNTDKESASAYPAPDVAVIHSVPTPELVRSKSASDSYSDADTNADVDVDAERGASAPPPTPTPADTFQPVPPAVKKQKAKRGDVEPEPAMITNGPPIMRLLAQHTGYWPGADVAPTLVQEFGESPDEPVLARAVELWRASGHKLTNWLGIADWYQEIRRKPDWTPQDRFKNGNGSNGHGKPTPPKSVSTPAPGSQPVTW